jgi:hypothetical protein
MDEFVARIEAIATADRIVEEMTSAAREVPLFLPLSARLVAVIEANVAGDPLFAAKRAFAGHNARIAAHLGALLDLPPARAAEVTATLALAMQGAAQFDISARRDLTQVPEDLRPMFAAHGFANELSARGPADPVSRRSEASSIARSLRQVLRLRAVAGDAQQALDLFGKLRPPDPVGRMQVEGARGDLVALGVGREGVERGQVWRRRSGEKPDMAGLRRVIGLAERDRRRRSRENPPPRSPAPGGGTRA